MATSAHQDNSQFRLLESVRHVSQCHIDMHCYLYLEHVLYTIIPLHELKKHPCTRSKLNHDFHIIHFASEDKICFTSNTMSKPQHSSTNPTTSKNKPNTTEVTHIVGHSVQLVSY